MTRAVGEFDVVDALPEAIVVLFAAVTHLADPWFLFALLAATYWFADARVADAPRRSGATAIALVTCAFAAVALSKAAFALPRPPGADPVAVTAADVPSWLPPLLAAWYEGQLVSDGFGFPSGHATGAVVAYGALALLVNGVSTRRRRIAVAGVLAGAVAISRVVLEVHYLADVVVGGVLGVVVLGIGLWLAGGRRRVEPPWRRIGPSNPEPLPVFLLAAGLSLVAMGVAALGGHGDQVVEAGIGVGTGLGGAVGWLLVAGDEDGVPLRLAVPGLALTGGVWAAAFAVGGGPITTVVATGVAVGGVLAMPPLGERVRV